MMPEYTDLYERQRRIDDPSFMRQTMLGMFRFGEDGFCTIMKDKVVIDFGKGPEKVFDYLSIADIVNTPENVIIRLDDGNVFKILATRRTLEIKDHWSMYKPGLVMKLADDLICNREERRFRIHQLR